MTDLGDYFRRQAGLRESKAREYRDDERNLWSARALRALATFVEEEPPPMLGDMAPSVIELLEKQVDTRDPANPTLGGACTRQAVGDYGYNGPPPTVARHMLFLEELVAQLCEDAYEYAGAHFGEDPSGMLREFERDGALEGIDLDHHYWGRRIRADLSWCEQWVEHSRLPDREKLDMLDLLWARGGGRQGQPATILAEEPETRG